MHPESARTLGDPAQLSVRMRRLGEPHVSALNDWVSSEGTKRDLSMPWLDPDDAGVSARTLFLLESPGPKADANAGSGIISVDNDDPTAANLWGLRRRAGVLSGALHWNAVPWYLGSSDHRVVAPSPGDRKRGSGC